MERKKEADSLQAEDKKIELLLQEAFDYSDEQLLKELEMAEAQVESAKMAAQDRQQGEEDSTAADGMAVPLGEFEKILEKMRERGISTELEKELNRPNAYSSTEPDVHLRSGETSELERPPEAAVIPDTPHTSRRFRRGAWKLLLAAVMAAGLLWAAGIGVSGRKYLEYRANVRDSEKSNIAWNNEPENYIEVDSEEEAYKIIGEKLGIPVLKIGYRPEGMEFSKLVLQEEFALVIFKYKEKNVHLMQGRGFNENSIAFTSDRKKSIEVLNNWMDLKIVVQENQSSENEIEYSFEFEREKCHYYLSGVMDRQEFLSIAEDININ